MHDDVCTAHSGANGFAVDYVPRHQFSAQRTQAPGLRVVRSAHQSGDLPAAPQEGSSKGPADKAGATGQEDFHRRLGISPTVVDRPFLVPVRWDPIDNEDNASCGWSPD